MGQRMGLAGGGQDTVWSGQMPMLSTARMAPAKQFAGVWNLKDWIHAIQ